MNDRNNEIHAVTALPPVQALIHQVESRIDHLNERLEILRDRLKPVLLDAPADLQGGPNRVAIEPQCEIARGLAHSLQMLGAAHDRLDAFERELQI